MRLSVVLISVLFSFSSHATEDWNKKLEDADKFDVQVLINGKPYQEYLNSFGPVNTENSELNLARRLVARTQLQRELTNISNQAQYQEQSQFSLLKMAELLKGKLPQGCIASNVRVEDYKGKPTLMFMITSPKGRDGTPVTIEKWQPELHYSLEMTGSSLRHPQKISSYQMNVLLGENNTVEQISAWSNDGKGLNCENYWSE